MSAADRRPRLAVVGVGSLGRHHARIYAELEEANLVAVVDTDPSRAKEVAERHGARVVATAAELAGHVDAASVAVPTEVHHRVALTLLEAGIDVLVEKPLAQTVEEGVEIQRAGTRCGRIVMVGHSERFHPAVAALQREVDAPRFFEIHRLAGFSARSTDIDVVLDLMIHDLDLLLHLDGTEPVSIDAAGVAALTDKVDIANARIRMESGCVANLTASRISMEPVRRIRLFQKNTYLVCDTGQATVERYRLVSGPAEAPRIEHVRLDVADEEPLKRELAEFLAAVRARRPPAVDGRQGLRALQLAHRVRDAIRPG